MKEQITSAAYWDLPDNDKKLYERVALMYDGWNWVERQYFGSDNVRIEVIYVLKSVYNRLTFEPDLKLIEK